MCQVPLDSYSRRSYRFVDGKNAVRENVNGKISGEDHGY